MTRDQLIEKRKKKKRMHRIAAVVSVAGVTALAVAGVRFMRSEDHANPGEFGTHELTEVEEIISEYGGEEVLFLGSEAETAGQDPKRNATHRAYRLPMNGNIRMRAFSTAMLTAAMRKAS